MEERKLPLTEEQWSCLRVRMQETGEGMKRVVPCLIKALEGQLSAKRVRRAVAELLDAGYLSGREYLPTKKAERLYRYYLLPWEAICHEQEKLGIEPGERVRIADHLLVLYPSSALERLSERCREEQERAAGEVHGELITDTDFSGKIPFGSYQVAFELLEGGRGSDRGNAEENARQRYREAELSSAFLPSARLIIAPQKSCLELSWIREGERLCSIRCRSKNERTDFKNEGGKVRIPLTAFSFEYVPNYRILQGELAVQLITEGAGEEETERKSRALLLELPLLFD